MRCFVAIPLPREVKDEVVRVQKELRRLDLHAKWVEQDNLHVTMKFLGQVQEADLDKAKQIVSGISSFARPFCLKLSGLGAFPDVRRPRVLWIGISPQDNPVAIISHLEDGFIDLGIPKEKRTPHPHITMARVKSPKNTQRLKQALSELKLENLKWDVEGITLFRSLLKPSGPVYEEILTAHLTV